MLDKVAVVVTNGRMVDHPLKVFREKQNPRLSQAQLAYRLGVGRVTVNRWETGLRPIGLQFLQDISRKTGIPARQLRPDIAELVREEVA